MYGFATAWFLLAPPDLLGLNLGAVGLALKTVCVQCLTVNLYLWLASRFIPLNFWRNFAHQIWSLAALLLLAFACRELTIDLGFGDLDSFRRFFISGVLYSLLCLGLCLAVPQVLGLSRRELRELFIRLKKSRRGA